MAKSLEKPEQALESAPTGNTPSVVPNDNLSKDETQASTKQEMNVAQSGTGESGKYAFKADMPTAFKQTKFASTYEARIHQTPAPENKKVMFIDGDRGETVWY